MNVVDKILAAVKLSSSSMATLRQNGAEVLD